MWAANKSLIVTCDKIYFIALLKAYKYGQQNALQVNYYGMQNYPSESQSSNFIYKNP